LPEVPPDELPGPLRRIARFTPSRRAKLGGGAIAGQLAADPGFRAAVAERVILQAGELGEAVRRGALPAAADPVEVAALAYVTRPTGWQQLVDSATEAVQVAA